MQPARRGGTAIAAVALVLVAQGLLVASIPAASGGLGQVRGLVVSIAPPAGKPGPVLVPGSALALDLTVENPYRVPVRVTELDVRVSSVRAGRSRCRSTDFTTSAGRPVDMWVPALGSANLRVAQVPRERWPSISMRERSGVGCRGVALMLELSARARLT